MNQTYFDFLLAYMPLWYPLCLLSMALMAAIFGTWLFRADWRDQIKREWKGRQ